MIHDATGLLFWICLAYVAGEVWIAGMVWGAIYCLKNGIRFSVQPQTRW